MPVKYQKFISRQDLKDNPDTLYVFGDNFVRKGFGGQAKEMRGEPNAVGLPTKKYPSFRPEAFLTDDDLEEVLEKSRPGIVMLLNHLKSGKNVVIPTDGVGTGLAGLGPNSAILTYYENVFNRLKKI